MFVTFLYVGFDTWCPNKPTCGQQSVCDGGLQRW